MKIFSFFTDSIGGRNSAVECQLPKLDVVGSSPIARSIFLKISSFLLLHAVLVFSSGLTLYAQVTTDVMRPFEQGQVIELPGTREYLGDLPQEIEWISDPCYFHTVEGLLSQQVGWVGQGVPTSLGINNGSPAILFEGVPYPFASASILNWLPVDRNLELMNFPASAWWGPTAATGAVQIRLPDPVETPMRSLALGGGSGGMGAGQGFFQNSVFSFDGNVQHGYLKGFGLSDTFNVLSGMKWAEDSPVKIESGFLGSQWFGGDNWYSFFTSFKWSSANFQTLELKPFLQTAQLNGREVQEFGSQVNYHFNMAGLIESQLELGFVHDDFTPWLAQGSDREYIQNMETFDALGDLLLNVAFRWDLSSAAATSFSTIWGAQYLMGDFRFLGNYAKDVDQLSYLDIQEGELGFRYQPQDDLSCTAKYVYEQVGSNLWNGERVRVQWIPEGTLFLVFREVQLEVEEQALSGTAGTTIFDTSCLAHWSFFQPLAFWLEGRGISEQSFYNSAGIDCLIKDQAKIYISVENFTDLPVSWPDPTTPQGRIFWVGAQTVY